MDLPTTIQLLVSIHKDQTAVVNSLWIIYQGISLATLGYVFSQEFVRKSPLILGCLTAGFIFFALANQQAILRSQELIYATTTQLKAIASNPSTGMDLQAVLNAYDAVSVSTLKFAHYTFSALILIAIWVPFAVFRFLPR